MSEDATNATPPWGPLGYVTYKRTYARPMGDRTEEFTDTVQRIVTSCNTQLGINFTEQEQKELYDILFNLKGSVAGRFLWQLGTNTVDTLGLLSLQNCAHVTINEPIRPFTWAFDALMLGAGVGYNLQREYVYELPSARAATITRKDTKDADFIVPDSREGWVELLRKTLESHFITGVGFSFSTVCIRGKGTPIAGFGGVASGPEELSWGISEISKLLNGRAGKKVRPIDCLDIMNILGFIVVSGNVRRSAQIAIGDMDDLQFLNAKRWDLGSIPNWRAMSNNTVVCNNIKELPEQYWEAAYGNGEFYGLLNLKLSQTTGRLGEERPDPLVKGTNPCGEMSLGAYETCCLAEVFLPNISSKEEFFKVLKYLYIINKHSLNLKCHHKETETIVHKNQRMGIGVTGVQQASATQLSWLNAGYEYLRNLDTEYSKKFNWPQSVKLTTVKPSGTLSLLAGVTAGAHPGFSQYYIRRIRIAANSNLVDVCKSKGYFVEPQINYDRSLDPNTMVVEFPCKHPEGTTLAKDLTAVDQLEMIKALQESWSDNAVSCTIYYLPEDLPKIREWLKNNYTTSIKSCSFLLQTGHGYDQAPLEEISKEKYDELIQQVTPITSIEVKESDIYLEECAGGQCPVK